MADTSTKNLGPILQQSQMAERIVFESLQEFSQDLLMRSTSASMWEEIAELIDPPSRNTFFFGDFNWPGVKKTDRQIDCTGMMALTRFCAILDSLLTPRNMEWHMLEADDDYVNKDRDTRLYFQECTKRLFKARYDPFANFAAQNYSNYKSLGAYGTGGMFTDAFAGVPRRR